MFVSVIVNCINLLITNIEIDKDFLDLKKYYHYFFYFCSQYLFVISPLIITIYNGQLIQYLYGTGLILAIYLAFYYV